MRAVLKEINGKYKFEYFLFLGMSIINTFIRNIIVIIVLNLIRLFLSFFINKIQILKFRKINIEVNDIIIKKLYSKDTLEVLKLDPIQTADRITEDTNYYFLDYNIYLYY